MENTENTEKNQNIPENKEYDEKGRLVFKKGYSGNPAGKPKGVKHFTTIVEEALRKIATTDKGEKVEIERALGEKVVRMALEGNEKMIKLIWNYKDGMPTQKIDLGNDDEIWDKLKEIQEKLKLNEPKE